MLTSCDSIRESNLEGALISYLATEVQAFAAIRFLKLANSVVFLGAIIFIVISPSLLKNLRGRVGTV